MYLTLKSHLYNKSLIIKENQASFFASLQMQLRDIKFIRTHSLILNFQSKLNKTFEVFLKNILNSQKFIFFYSSLDSVISTIAIIIIYILGGISVIKGKNSIGEFTIIISYFNFIISSFKYFCNLGKLYQDNLVSYNRITEIFNIKQVPNGDVQMKSIGTIDCVGLNFIRNNKLIIDKFTYQFKKGYSYCIYGANGIGKTTLIELIIGLYQDEYSGTIKFNSIDTKDIDMIDLRMKKISILEQKLTLLEGEIDANVYLSEEHKDINIAKNTKDINTIVNLNYGNINSDKSGVSGGEAQKMGVKRLLSKDADLFILDEPTSALDEISKNVVISIIKELSVKKIVIIISHDKQMINACDFALTLNKE